MIMQKKFEAKKGGGFGKCIVSGFKTINLVNFIWGAVRRDQALKRGVMR